jgi:hypothetical protein
MLVVCGIRVVSTIASMIGSLLDTILDRTVLTGYTRVGYCMRRAMWSAVEEQPMGNTARASEASLREFRIVLVGLPALIIGFIILRGLWRDGGVAARRQKLAELGWAEVADYGSEKPLPPLETPAESTRPIRLDLRFARSYGRPAQPAPNHAIPGRSRTLLHVERITSAHAWPARASASTSRPGRVRVTSAGDRLADQLCVGRLCSRAAPQDPHL